MLSRTSTTCANFNTAFPGCPRGGGEVQRRTVSVRRTQGERVEYNCYEEVGSYKSIPFSDIVKVAQRTRK